MTGKNTLTIIACWIDVQVPLSAFFDTWGTRALVTPARQHWEFRLHNSPLPKYPWLGNGTSLDHPTVSIGLSHCILGGWKSVLSVQPLLMEMGSLFLWCLAGAENIFFMRSVLLCYPFLIVRLEAAWQGTMGLFHLYLLPDRAQSEPVRKHREHKTVSFLES